ncbi:MAG: hypothetical protein OXF41_18045 [bacterium]|nr:hypothetical protein [bacterium]
MSFLPRDQSPYDDPVSGRRDGHPSGKTRAGAVTWSSGMLPWVSLGT